MKRNILIGAALLLGTGAMAQNAFHFNNVPGGKRQDIGVSSSVLTFGRFVNDCDGQYPEHIDWNQISIGIGTPFPTEQLHTTRGVRFEGLTQDDDQSRIIVQDNAGRLFWRDASTLGGGTPGNFWSLTGNAITAGNFFGTTNDQDIVFKRFNVRAGVLNVNNSSYGLRSYNPASTGVANTAIGVYALTSNADGNGNTASGSSAMYFNSSGSYNTAYGVQSLYANTTGNFNTAIGEVALTANNTGIGNTAAGNASLYANTIGNNNSAFGTGALRDNVSGYLNTAVGAGAGHGIVSGIGNTIIGPHATSNLPANLFNTIVLATGFSIRLYIDDAGHAGLGTTTPTAMLHVNCNNGAPVAGASNVRFENLQSGAGHILVIDDSGYVKKATATASKVPQEEVDAIKEELANTRQELEATKQDMADLKTQVQALLGANHTATASDNAQENTLEIVPTPFSDHAKAVYRMAHFSGAATLQIIDAKGVLIRSLPVTQAAGELEIGHIELSSGTVIFNLIADGQIVATKRSVKL